MLVMLFWLVLCSIDSSSTDTTTVESDEYLSLGENIQLFAQLYKALKANTSSILTDDLKNLINPASLLSPLILKSCRIFITGMLLFYLATIGSIDSELKMARGLRDERLVSLFCSPVNRS